MAACGIDLDAEARSSTRSTSTRRTRRCSSGTRRRSPASDSLTGDWYDCSAHLLWIGDRTRQLDGAHVEFLAGRAEPDRREARARTSTPDEVRRAVRAAQPRAPRPAGSRSSAAWAPTRSPSASRRCCGAVQRRRPPRRVGLRPDARQHVQHESGYKTRHFDDVMGELRGFFAVCDDAGVWPGGVHVELTGEDVTECLGGAEDVLGAHLEQRYETMCDPRLNARQSLDLAFQTAELLRR